MTGFRAAYLPGFGIHKDFGECDFDVQKVFHLSGTYDLPVGHGRHFLKDSRGVVDAFIGGWDTNWILTLQDGQPGTIPCTISTTSGFGCNALRVAGQDPYAGPHNVDQWLNAAAFASPPVATTIGQTDYSPLGGGPSQFRGPGFHRLDFSLFKEFRTTEQHAPGVPGRILQPNQPSQLLDSRLLGQWCAGCSRLTGLHQPKYLWNDLFDAGRFKRSARDSICTQILFLRMAGEIELEVDLAVPLRLTYLQRQWPRRED